MIVRLIHGIHSPEGDNNMSAFAPHIQAALPRAEVELFQYGFMGFWAARWENDGVASQFAEIHRHGKKRGVPEVWVTHSNGAAIAYLAVQKFGATPDMIVNFNPALDRWRTADVPRVETIFSEQDRAVDVAQWLPFHIWGDQGKVGYRGKKQNTLSRNGSMFPAEMAYKNHNGAFHPERIASWARFTALRASEFLPGGSILSAR